MILIRADANSKIGAGHIMRCRSIADVLIKRGEDVTFVTADHKGDQLLSGYRTVCMNTEWTDMASELVQLQQYIKEKKPKAMLIDSYCVQTEYFKCLLGLVKTIYIDDLNVGLWDVDALINYNIFGPVFDYSTYENTRTELLLGTLYAPIRAEFKSLPLKEIKSDVSHVMISAGGADPERVTEKIMLEICPSMEGICFHFVLGVLNPRNEVIRDIVKKNENIVLHVNETNMSGLMEMCDVAISAAGTTLYELCAVGVPTIAFSLADNQLGAAAQFQLEEIMINAGDCRENPLFIRQVEVSLRKLMNDLDLRCCMSQKMRGMVDGKGSDRIAEYILNHC